MTEPSPHPLPSQIIKTDSTGRMLFPTELREELLDRFEKSDLSAPEFAERHHIKYQTFATWRQRRKQEREEKPLDAQPGFVEVAIPPAEKQTERGVTVELPAGARVRITNETEAILLAKLLGSLESRPC